MSKGSRSTRSTNSKSAHNNSGRGNTLTHSPDTKKLFDLQEKYDIAKAAADAARYRGNTEAIIKATGEAANAGYELDKAIRENPKGAIYKERKALVDTAQREVDRIESQLRNASQPSPLIDFRHNEIQSLKNQLIKAQQKLDTAKKNLLNI